MTAVAEAALAKRLEEAAAQLQGVLSMAEGEVADLTADFQSLAGEMGVVLEQAAGIVACAEDEQVRAVMPRVQLLGTAVRKFIHQRLQATTGILQAVTAETRQLEILGRLTHRQKGIARETEMLRVLTNIEVARLGDVGMDFQYLAHELDDFSRSVAASTGELMQRTDERRKAMEEMRQGLTAELPRARAEYTRMEAGLGAALAQMEATLQQLLETPLRFRASAEEIAAQIAGVVSAIQAHDITRQQIEHVEESLTAMAAELGADPEAAAGPAAQAGLAIQSYQLRKIQETVQGWIRQVAGCVESIARIASSELLELGRRVASQEEELTAQLALIGRVEEQCGAANEKVQSSLQGITGLMDLVREHLARSRSVRDRLQLLMFNSIIEASHLGTQADGILEISRTIKRIAATWGEITGQSEAAMQAIAALVEGSHGALAAFSGEGSEELRTARQQTQSGLDVLHGAGQCAETRGAAIRSATDGLQARMGEIRSTNQRLEEGFARLGAVLAAVGEMQGVLASHAPGAEAGWDAEAMEERFGARYTTEMERAVLRAALTGAELPSEQQSLAGNDVELF